MYQRAFVTMGLALFTGIFCGCSRKIESAPQSATPPDSSSLSTATAPATTASASATTASASPPSSASATPTKPGTQRFPLRGGQTAVVDAEDHVVILAADGSVSAESWCGSNGIKYRQAVDFLTKVEHLVEASDKAALAELVKFPLHAAVPVKNRAEFLAHYDKLFSPAEVAAITHADPGAISCRNGAFMLGDGEIWAAPDSTGSYRVTTINPGPPAAH